MKGIYGLKKILIFIHQVVFQFIIYGLIDYIHISFYNFKYKDVNDSEEDILYNIKQKLSNAVEKRLLSDRPIGCLLSIDWIVVLLESLVCKFMDPSKVKTFSIGLEGSPDLIASKKVL